MNLSRRTMLAASALAFPAFAQAAPLTLAQAVAAPSRSPKNVARDKYRHPQAMLEFFGLRPTQSVLEIEPGGGYWTEILAPYLAPHGHYTASLPTGSAEADKEAQFFLAKLKTYPASYGAIATTVFSATQPVAPPATQDLVLSFRNLHDWLEQGTAQPILAGIAAALKPGGVFGIEDHRAPANLPQDPKAKDGYVREDFAITLIESTGLKLAARANIGANPRDTKNYPDGVWDLPPVLRQGETNRAKYLAIGESDRWTLKFVKPR